jgi:putative ABC transport system substrate-binding protein
MRLIGLAVILAVGLTLAPLAAETQQARSPRLGVLLFSTPETDPNVAAFRQELADLGHTESRSITIEYRDAGGKPERLRDLAAELVAAKPDVILALGGDVTPFVRAATGTIPIVMVVSNDPVAAGLVASMGRPGANVTGVTFVSSDLAAKRLQFLKEMAPRVSRVGVLWNPDHVDPEYRETQKAAQALGMRVQSLEVRNAGDLDAAWQSASATRVEAVIAVSSRLMTTNRQRIIESSRERRLPLASGWGPWAKEGALFSYGPDLNAMTRRAASYVDKILKGAKPGDLPVEQPTKFELVINLKTAKALGLTIPQTLLQRADQLIQ